MQDAVALFGRLPDPWWGAFKDRRHTWFDEFDENGQPDDKSSI